MRRETGGERVLFFFRICIFSFPIVVGVFAGGFVGGVGSTSCLTELVVLCNPVKVSGIRFVGE